MSPVDPGPEQESPMDIPTNPVVAPRPRGTSALSVLLGIALLIAIGGVAFAAGRLTAPSTATANGGAPGFARGANGAPGAGGAPGYGFGRGGGFGAGGGAGAGGNAGVSIEGKVTEIASDHLTIQLSSGTTIQVPISTSTTYHRQSDATATDVTSGSQVLIRVQGRPGGAGAPAASGSPSASGNPGQLPGTATDITIVSQ
jgi:hypothetical protein